MPGVDGVMGLRIEFGGEVEDEEANALDIFL